MSGDARDAGRVAGLVLAAGGGRRLGGRPKALLPRRGRPLVEHAVDVVRRGGCDPVYVVLGASAAQVRQRADLTGCVLVDNPGWGAGMGSSLRAGLHELARRADADAALVALVDQPGVGARAVARVRAAHRGPASLAAASYGGRRGHPVLLGAAHWDGVARTASGDRGARSYLREHAAALTLVECADVADPADVDTPQDLALLE
ncbi:NTP transferase domain-containing protein [Streptomyces sp. TRM 70351]|uniref:nucleotidyltransferase family protein n=1 Tax=Streptomyces sp. TRM 70351 TaxID=3116552 RepID=UPI002E7BE7E5|nr:NTP transferase domain-containing protein [Streptomyces sp. TRM 70351]MEE1926891.1 NTP transferase domain-containing protein [Streptomyces sp. TRM 70351]